MNWYKKANIWDEIKKYGPNTYGDNAEAKNDLAIDYLVNTEGIGREEAEERVNKKHMTEYYRRRGFIDNYGWSVPNKEIIDSIKTFVGNDLVLEVGSGYGLWAKLMRDIGINVIATNRIYDKRDRQDTAFLPRGADYNFTDVEKLNHLEALNKYQNANVLLLNWPPDGDRMAYESLISFKGNKLIFVGESKSGCTGCDKFFDLIESDWKWIGNWEDPEHEEYATVELQNWKDMSDKLYFYIRK